MRVIVLMAGDLGDSSVVGVFSNKGQVDKYLAVLDDEARREYTAEEYEVDSLPPLDVKRYWHVGLNAFSAVVIDYSGVARITRISTGAHFRGTAGSEQFLSEPEWVWFWGVSTESRDHAFKLAVEAKQEFIRKMSGHYRAMLRKWGKDETEETGA